MAVAASSSFRLAACPKYRDKVLFKFYTSKKGHLLKHRYVLRTSTDECILSRWPDGGGRCLRGHNKVLGFTQFDYVKKGWIVVAAIVYD